jgi:4,5-DOPA dioxygenase extradiol
MKPQSLPILFVGHGSPMNAIEDNPFSRTWARLGQTLPRPETILCISAHWQTRGTQITAMEKPRTIYDFSGFPPELYQQKYPAPGSVELARRVQAMLGAERAGLDNQWGLDHGTWSVLLRMYPQADIPVVQLSLDVNIAEGGHYELAKRLRPLRDEGVLVMGSGNMVHNLGLLNWAGEPFDWALQADAQLKTMIEQRDHPALISFPTSSREARLAVPTNEHYLPALYILALQDADESLTFFNEAISLGSLAMRGFVSAS